MPKDETPTLPTIASMWVGDPMSFVEIVTMKSFIEQGHKFILYTLEDVGYVPEGVELADPREILSPAFEIGPGMRHNNAVYTDLFRLYMVQKTGAIWADLDAYCLKPFSFSTGFVFGLEEDDPTSRFHTVANGVMGLPQESVALQTCISLISQENPIPPFFNGGRRKRLQKRIDNGETFGFQNFGWGVSGPKMLDWALKDAGEKHHAMQKDVFYPGPRPSKKPLLNPDFPIDALETPDTVSIHIYGKTKNFLKQEFDGVLPAGCYLDTICRRHNVDPKEFPV